MNGGLHVIGAGMWRTATYSLKLALEELTAEPCMHMSDIMPRRGEKRAYNAEQWLRVVRGDQPPDWFRLLAGYGSTIDWPTLMFWQELMKAYPMAKILLSTRDSESWWQSINNTVLQVIPAQPKNAWENLILELFERDFIGAQAAKQQAIQFYEQHSEQVRKLVPKDRLIEWKFGDSWEPLCSALDVPVPNKPFPHTNTTAEFRRGNNLLRLASSAKTQLRFE